MVAAPLMLLQAYLAYSPRDSTSPVFYVAHFVQQILGVGILRLFSNVLFSAHALESLYTFHLCRKHHTGFSLGVSPQSILTHCTGLNPPLLGSLRRIDSFVWLPYLDEPEEDYTGCKNRLGHESRVTTIQQLVPVSLSIIGLYVSS